MATPRSSDAAERAVVFYHTPSATRTGGANGATITPPNSTSSPGTAVPIMSMTHVIMSLRRDRRYTVTMVGIIAAAVGVDGVVFALLHGVLPRALPITAPPELVRD